MNPIARQAATLVVIAGAVIAGSTAQPAHAAGPESACTAIGGTVDTNQICHSHATGAGYEVTFTFPVDYPDQQALTAFLTQRRQDFIDFAAEYPPRVRHYELDARADAYHSGTPTSGTKSLVFQQYSESGGAHPVTSYHALNYDVGKGAAITFATLFKPGVDAVAVLDPIVQREMQKHWDGYGGGPGQENTLGEKVYQDFAVTDDAVIFFIGQGMWLPEVAGPQEVSVPRSKLASILA